MSTHAIDIHRVATLARLELTEDEATRYQQQLDRVLDYMDTLRSLDLEGVEPTSHALPVCDVVRADGDRPSFTQDEALANAPRRVMDQFQIPKVIE
ncbi:MAG: Asp-tRNA(Asn)/Glu-tRNA(Gln) amidotransferase subunit GatC [Verrucomicrobiales bacterium]|nr:Asp-tRNA(Asn)/Glu-tRNA(Gln) amidotransferase subunit GatC [Verrucomicrobiales bacterium]